MSRAEGLRRAVIALGGLALVAYPLVRLDDIYGQSVLIFAFLLALMASGWNIMAGFTGYVSIGQSAFLGIGAYTVALLALRTGLSPLLLAPLGGVAAALVAAVLGATVMRAREHAFVIITIALLFLFQALALNLGSITGGSNGLTLPLPAWDRDIQNLPFYYAMLGLAALQVLLSWWIRRTKFGMGLIAIREDEDKAAAVGVRTSAYKVLSFVASAVLIGVAGGVYAYFLSFIDPRGMFDILVSVQLVLAALVGGRGTIWGPVLGAFLVVPLNEAANNLAATEGLHLFAFGLALGAVVMFLPRGLLPTVQEWWSRRQRRQVPWERRPQVSAADREPPPAPAPAGHALLEVDALGKRFGGVAAVDACSFAVREGSRTGLIGPNGSGKTTTFNLVTGMVRGDGGAIRFDGRRVDRAMPWERAHLGLGRTFQITRLVPRMTVLENLVAPLRGFSWANLAADAVSGPQARRAEELLDLVGMLPLAAEPAGRLSFGQQKLVELAQVLMLEPRLVLLDEPAGGVNPGMIDRIAELIVELNRQGITFLIVEHNMPMVLELCDPILVMAAGKVIAEGPPRAIQRDPVVLDAYLGEGWGKATPVHGGSGGLKERSGSPPVDA
ncbi:MAG TPA: branched-chain amino acid ABC transporter ATP-binding protein/permease [Actinomycetota bacterium]|nr:branched-chain amino acid ABC transporter ATP-binding protein/permease [Actinomycetota bacterium]